MHSLQKKKRKKRKRKTPFTKHALCCATYSHGEYIYITYSTQTKFRKYTLNTLTLAHVVIRLKQGDQCTTHRQSLSDLSSFLLFFTRPFPELKTEVYRSTSPLKTVPPLAPHPPKQGSAWPLPDCNTANQGTKLLLCRLL